mmetsp:Transcript_52032/g.97630  ORF Transcript_52032/g.97630 Transcript_52032/m.97630 type:complete len:141 (-) Transcript_52032:859-1281(-)
MSAGRNRAQANGSGRVKLSSALSRVSGCGCDRRRVTADAVEVRDVGERGDTGERVVVLRRLTPGADEGGDLDEHVDTGESGDTAEKLELLRRHAPDGNGGGDAGERADTGVRVVSASESNSSTPQREGTAPTMPWPSAFW